MLKIAEHSPLLFVFRYGCCFRMFSVLSYDVSTRCLSLLLLLFCALSFVLYLLLDISPFPPLLFGTLLSLSVILCSMDLILLWCFGFLPFCLISSCIFHLSCLLLLV